MQYARPMFDQEAAAPDDVRVITSWKSSANDRLTLWLSRIECAGRAHTANPRSTWPPSKLSAVRRLLFVPVSSGSLVFQLRLANRSCAQCRRADPSSDICVRFSAASAASAAASLNVDDAIEQALGFIGADAHRERHELTS